MPLNPVYNREMNYKKVQLYGEFVFLIIILTLIVSCGGSGAQLEQTTNRIITIAALDSLDSMNADYKCDGESDDIIIQNAINLLSKNPGINGKVVLLDGNYYLNAAIHLKSNISLVGSSFATVLHHPNEVSTILTDKAYSNQRHLNVLSTHNFKSGMSLYISDDYGGKKYKIKDIVDKTSLTLTTDLLFEIPIGSSVFHVFPIIDVDGQSDGVRYSNISIENLKIEGNKANVSGHSWLHSAITFWNVEKSTIKNLWISNSSFEGISDQGFYKDTFNLITNNIITGSRNHGIHLGTGYSKSTITNNIISSSGNDGIFFCIAVRGNNIAGNTIEFSKNDGIGGIDCCFENYENGDAYNYISNNIIRSNMRFGIGIAGAYNNIFYNNSIYANKFCNVDIYNGNGNIFDSNFIGKAPCGINDFSDSEHLKDKNPIINPR